MGIESQELHGTRNILNMFSSSKQKWEFSHATEGLHDMPREKLVLLLPERGATPFDVPLRTVKVKQGQSPFAVGQDSRDEQKRHQQVRTLRGRFEQPKTASS
jgi:hypothetical protein